MYLIIIILTGLVGVAALMALALALVCLWIRTRPPGTPCLFDLPGDDGLALDVAGFDQFDHGDGAEMIGKDENSIYRKVVRGDPDVT